ncbi:MAG TPA: lipocalin family protein [Chryseosolibacter sp.]
MTQNRIVYTMLLFFTLVLSACKEEAEISAPIVGKWNGQEADFKINPSGIIPAFTLNEDELPVQLEFKNDGKLVLTDKNGVSKNGSYNQSGQQLTITIDYTFELIDMSGTYTIKELTNTTLQAETEREGSYTHPDTGQQFDGKVTATLVFTRAAN